MQRLLQMYQHVHMVEGLAALAGSGMCCVSARCDDLIRYDPISSPAVPHISSMPRTLEVPI